MTLAELLLITVVIILGDPYQKIWYTIRDQQAQLAMLSRTSCTAR